MATQGFGSRVGSQMKKRDVRSTHGSLAKAFQKKNLKEEKLQESGNRSQQGTGNDGGQGTGKGQWKKTGSADKGGPEPPQESSVFLCSCR